MSDRGSLAQMEYVEFMVKSLHMIL
jgi:hypothetical protein